MDWSTVAGDGLLAAATFLAAREARKAHRVGEDNKRKLDRVERQTNGAMERKIREAVRDEMLDHLDNTEAMRDLLDGLLMGIQATADEEGTSG